VTDEIIDAAANRYRDLLDRLAKTKLGADLDDDNERRRTVFRFMENGDNPVTRELGQELRAGNIDLRSVDTVPAYADVLRAGLDRLNNLDLGAMGDRLEALVEAEENREARTREAIEDAEDDDNQVPVILEDNPRRDR
jgi:hypothetical protein